MGRPSRRRARLARQRRQRPRQPPPDLARRHHRRLDVHPRRRPRGAHRPGRRRTLETPYVLGQFEDDGARLDPDGQVLALSTQGQASLRRSWARAVPLDGGPATTLPYGPVGDVVTGSGGQVVLLSAPMGREAAWWKRYRGGTAGKLWIDRAGDGEFVRLHEELDGNIEYPMWVGDRVAFLSDHEGVGALYSSRGRQFTAPAHAARRLLRPARVE